MKHLKEGDLATGTKGYIGLHRDVELVLITDEMEVVGVSLGNRSTKPFYGESEVDERDSDPNIRRF